MEKEFNLGQLLKMSENELSEKILSCMSFWQEKKDVENLTYAEKIELLLLKPKSGCRVSWQQCMDGKFFWL